QDAGGDGLEHELLAAHHHRMAGVVPALVTDDDTHVGGQHVHDLALALVAPLGAHHHDVRHVRLQVPGNAAAGPRAAPHTSPSAPPRSPRPPGDPGSV